jgi:hypothetical protein
VPEGLSYLIRGGCRRRHPPRRESLVVVLLVEDLVRPAHTEEELLLYDGERAVVAGLAEVEP